MSNEQSVEKLPTVREIRRIPEFQPLRPKQLRFIVGLFRSNLIVEKASRRSGVMWRNHYYWMKHDEEYRQAVEKVKEMLGDLLEATMLDDAIIGREAPIVYKGEVTGSIREINAQERIALLRGLKPQYRDNYLAANQVGPVNVRFIFAPSSPEKQSAPIDTEVVIRNQDGKEPPATEEKE
jgi:hypothetical protein